MFGKKRKQRPAPAWLVRLVRREEWWRRRISYRLQVWTEAMSPARLRWVCFTVLLLAGLLNTWILVQALSAKTTAPAIEPVSVKPLLKRQGMGVGEDPSFLRELDSIQQDPVLKKSFDSLQVANPWFAEKVRELMTAATVSGRFDGRLSDTIR